MKIGAMNHPRGEIIAEINKIASLGLDFIDFTYEWPASDRFNVDEIKRTLKKSGLEVVGHTCPTLPAIYPLREARAGSIRELKEAFNFLKEIGARKVNIHPFYYSAHLNDEEIINRNIEVFKELADYAVHLELDLMLENFIAPFDNSEIFEKIIAEISSIKVHLDVAHLNISSDDVSVELQKFIKAFGKKIVHYHIHDNKGIADEHLPLGCGNINWEEIVRIIKASKYDGTFTLEVFSSDIFYLKYCIEKWRKLWLG